MASSRMIALLGLLAVAGYQNRDRLGELFGQVTGSSPEGHPVPSPASGEPAATKGGGIGGLLGSLGGLFGGSSPGEGVRGGLGDLVDSLTGAGHGEAAKSWVQVGPNREVSADQLEQALGADTMATLTQQTGLSRDELLDRLKTVLPAAVDKMTPEGRLPTQLEASHWG